MIGAKLPNPYALSTMKKAFGNLAASTKSGVSAEEITATHLYVKFIPTRDEELNSILIQEDLNLFLYPLDHELSEGWVVDDERYMVNGFKHRWCSVPVERDLSGIGCPYEVLEELFIPDDRDSEGNAVTRAAQHMSAAFVDDLVAEAFRVVGVDQKLIVGTRADVRPSGRVIAWDSTLGRYVGNEGQKVHAVRWFTTATGFCDANGYYSCDKTFSGEFDYDLHFGRNDFEIREEDSTSEIVYNRHAQTGPWNYTFTENSIQAFWSTLFRAAYMYYYQDIDGLRRPPLNGFWKAVLAIQAKSGSNPEALGYFEEKGRFILSNRPRITVYKQSYGTNISAIKVFGTTMHELAHAVHWGNDHDSYENCQYIVYESYARGIQHYLTSKKYDRDYNPQYWRRSYTGMARDLMSRGTNRVTSDYYKESYDSPMVNLTRSYDDRASGYTMKHIEDALIGCTTWTQWRDKIKAGPGGNTSVDIFFAPGLPGEQIDNNNVTINKTEVDEVFNYWNLR